MILTVFYKDQYYWHGIRTIRRRTATCIQNSMGLHTNTVMNFSLRPQFFLLTKRCFQGLQIIIQGFFKYLRTVDLLFIRFD